MGKIIVKNIKGMGWKSKFALITMFTLAFSVMIYQGWYQLRNANAAVANSTQWAIIGTSATSSTFNTLTLAKPTASNRLLVVKIVGEYGTATTTFQPTVTYGNQTLTRISSTDTTSRQKVWFGYLTEAQIAAASTTTFAVTWVTAPTAGAGFSAAFYSNVNQLNPINASRAVSSDTAATTPTSSAIVGVIDGWVVYGANVNTATTAPSTPPTNYTEHFDALNGLLYVDSVGSTIISATTTTSLNPQPTWTSNRYAFVAFTINPATTTLASGTDPVAQTVAPGTAAADVNAFTLVTTAATDTIASVTVTLSSNVGIGRLAITNDAGTTEYGFTAAPTNGANAITVTGMSVAQSATPTQFKVRVTPLAHTAMPAPPGGTYAITAPVASFVGTANIVHAGTDTNATALLTIDNTSPAPTTPFTGALSSGATGQVVLSWTNVSGETGFGVLVLRSTAAVVDVPVEGTYPAVDTIIGASTVRYAGTAATFTDATAVYGTPYHYKIFTRDVNGNYSSTGTAAGPYTPLSNDTVKPVVSAGFAATTPVSTLAVPITSLTATDDVGVAGYLITESATVPAAGDAGWTSGAPTSFTVSGVGSKTLYPWAKDAAGNVSLVYGSPVTVFVDQTLPTVSAFTVASATSTSKTISGITFTAADTGGSGVVGYLITTSATPPSVGAAWSGAAPTTYTVAADGNYTLYPWAKDAVGNISAVFATPRAVSVDTTGPAGLTAIYPADEATNVPYVLTLQASVATDVHGPVQYFFRIYQTDNPAHYDQNSGWISTNTFDPPVLDATINYTWYVRAQDSLGNISDIIAPNTFFVAAECTSNNPTLTLLTAGGGIAATITADGSSAVYKLKVINNDYGGCGNSTFPLSVAYVGGSTSVGDFEDPTLSLSSVSLAPGANTTVDVTVKAITGRYTGYARTTATFTPVSGDANHTVITSNYAQTTLNVVGCTLNSPILTIGPDTGYVVRNGSLAYTVTVKNADTGTGCAPVTFTLSSTDGNLTKFNASTLTPSALVLNSEEQGSAILTVSSQTGAIHGDENITSVGVTAPLHSSPANKSVTTTVGNLMVHNSDNSNSLKWSANNGWGIPGGRYGEFTCNTCHVDGYGSTNNIKRIRESITTPFSSAIKLPGDKKPIVFNRLLSTKSAQGSLGFDSTATPRASSSKICEVCHTYDATRVNGVNAHPYSTGGASLSNHYATDGVRECIDCHKHNNGFTPTMQSCNGCHGDSAISSITSSNRYVVAPPTNIAGATGTATGTALVSNDPKVGAHQTHLRYLKGYSNYSTVDYRCGACHGTLPTNYSHIDSSSSPQGHFQGKATKDGGFTASWTAATLTCNTYCHNPAGTGGTLKTVNAGTTSFVSWTSSSYLSNGAWDKTTANCNRCHKSPGDIAGAILVTSGAGAGTTTQHSTYTIAQNCSGCHGHNGDSSGPLGTRHMDGKLIGGGSACNECHAYTAAEWANPSFIKVASSNAEGAGVHVEHINWITANKGITLSAIGDNAVGGFGGGNAGAVCGVCHTNGTLGTHQDSTRTINFGDNSGTYQFGGSLPVYNGNSANLSATTPKTCSNLSCHYFTTPVWSSY